MIFCVWDRNISQRQKLGIMIGISIHMFTGYLQNANTSSSASPSGSLRKHHTLPSPHISDGHNPGSSLDLNGGVLGDKDPVDISLDLPVS